jgi:hypothetical protein
VKNRAVAEQVEVVEKPIERLAERARIETESSPGRAAQILRRSSAHGSPGNKTPDTAARCETNLRDSLAPVRGDETFSERGVRGAGRADYAWTTTTVRPRNSSTPVMAPVHRRTASSRSLNRVGRARPGTHWPPSPYPRRCCRGVVVGPRLLRLQESARSCRRD